LALAAPASSNVPALYTWTSVRGFYLDHQPKGWIASELTDTAVLEATPETGTNFSSTYLDIWHSFYVNMHQGEAPGAMVVRNLFAGITGSSPLDSFSCQTFVLDWCQSNGICSARQKYLEVYLALRHDRVRASINASELLAWNTVANELYYRQPKMLTVEQMDL
jgi:hypothetical protein